MSDRLTYSFGPLERRGIAGGIAAGQLAVLGGGALLAILVLDHAPSAGGAMLATIILAVAGATAFAPLGGRNRPGVAADRRSVRRLEDARRWAIS